MSYLAFVLDEKSRAAILQKFPPKHPDVIAHHVTLVHTAKVSDQVILLLDSLTENVSVVGYVADEQGEALIVSMNDMTIRPGGGFYHVTLSIDRAAGAKPVYSNTLIKEKEWTTVHPFRVTGKVVMCD